MRCDQIILLKSHGLVCKSRLLSESQFTHVLWRMVVCWFGRAHHRVTVQPAVQGLAAQVVSTVYAKCNTSARRLPRSTEHREQTLLISGILPVLQPGSSGSCFHSDSFGPAASHETYTPLLDQCTAADSHALACWIRTGYLTRRIDVLVRLTKSFTVD